MANEDYKNKLQRIQLDMHTLGTNYGCHQQDFVDSFFDDDGEIFIDNFTHEQKIYIDQIYEKHIERRD